MSLRVALIDDTSLFREGLRSLLSANPDLSVVGEASEARAGFALVESTKPDVVILDIALPFRSGIALTSDIVRRGEIGRVLILTMHQGDDYVKHALEAGASGYALKDQSIEELVEAIHAVAGNRRYMAPAISRLMLDRESSDPAKHARTALEQLSPREREVFDLVARSFSNRQISAQLCISVKTVETHRVSINRKLGVHSSSQLIRYAALRGLIAD